MLDGADRLISLIVQSFGRIIIIVVTQSIEYIAIFSIVFQVVVYIDDAKYLPR